MAQTNVLSDMNGSVWKLVVSEGDTVGEDDTLAVLESMKMEIPVLAPVGGKVEKLLVRKGQAVTEGAHMMTISH